MDFSLDNLKKSGAFTGPPVKRDIAWKQNGDECTATVYVRRMAYHAVVSELHAYNSKTDAVAARIAACIVDANGEAVFTPADVTGDADPKRGPLHGNLTLELLRVIGEVNNVEKPTSPASSTNSGMS